MPHQRTVSRELALQYLYMHDAMQGKDVQLLSDYLGACENKPDVRTAAYTRKLVETVLEHKDELDCEIAGVATNWKIARMAIVDRNILRLGLAELRCCPETPYRVVLDEAIELARRYSDEAACAFVNGILDKLCDQPAEPIPEGIVGRDAPQAEPASGETSPTAGAPPASSSANASAEPPWP